MAKKKSTDISEFLKTKEITKLPTEKRDKYNSLNNNRSMRINSNFRHDPKWHDDDLLVTWAKKCGINKKI